MDKRMSFCETCIKSGNGRAMHAAEARIHKDNFPNHDVVAVDKGDKHFETIEKDAMEGGEL